MFMILSAVLPVAACIGQAGEIALPELSKSSAWQTDEKLLTLGNIEGRITIELDRLNKATPTRITLKTPITVPANSELIFDSTMDRIYELYLSPIVRDSKGNEFLIKTDSKATLKDGMYLGGRFRGGLEHLGEVRVRSAGMRTFKKGSYQWVSKVNSVPVPPLKLIGFEVRTKSEKPRKNTVYLRNFRFTDVTKDTSKFYYQFDGKESFGEIDGLPSVCIGDFGMDWGKKFIIDWEVRRDYAGQPFMTGNTVFEPDMKSKIPMPLQLSKQIEFPVKLPGVSWIRAKIRWSAPVKTDRIWEKEYRLYVIKAEAGTEPKIIAPEQRIGNSMIRFAPDRRELIWGEDEKWELPIRFFDAAGKEAAVKVLDGGNNLLLEKNGTIGADGIILVDLTKLKPGAYTVTATVTDNGKTLDSLTRMVGKKSDPAKAKFTLPPGIPSARQLIDGPKPMFHIMPHIGVREGELEKIKGLMDIIGPTSKDFEYQVKWSKAEPFPGVYDFSELDAVLDYAKKKGLSVLVWPTFDAPEWSPSHYTMNEKGEIFGHTMYLFHGARLNMFHSPVLRQGAIDFVRSVVLHVRNHPATQGYYYLVEHPGEAPYAGWYEGFDPYTLGDFRNFAKKHYGSIEKANMSWNTKFGSFEKVMPPAINEESSAKFRVDWLRFRKDAVHDFLYDCAKAVRENDPHRLLMIYCSGILPERMNEFAALNVMTANGGCESPEKFAENLIQVADSGIPQRAEEVSVGQWAAVYPTRLDTSLFSMMLGGGANSSCKMFLPVETYLRSPEKNLDGIRKNPWALDRYEKFQPIWTELRQTEAIRGEVRYFSSINSRMLRYKTNAAGGGDPWATMFFLDSQVPFGMASGKDWQKAKLIVLPHGNLEYLEKQPADELVNYVKNGGAILMNADSGRYCVEDKDSDWFLLKSFGFNPPETLRANVYSKVAGAPGGKPENRAHIGSVRHLWTAGTQPGKTLALLSDSNNLPAITVKDFGKGQVFVIWAQEVQPPGKSGDKDYPMLRSIAEMCGVKLPVEVDSRLFWTNLLKHKTNENYYLLVMRNNWGTKEEDTCSVRLVQLPEGKYRMTELIGGKKISDGTTALELRQKGLTVKLGMREVAIYRLEHIK